MSPTPQQAIDGVRRILNDVVAPAITDPEALAALRDIRATLAQYRWNEVVPDLAARNVRDAQLVAHCAEWLSAVDGDRALSAAALLRDAPPIVEPFLNHVDYAARIADVVVGAHTRARLVLVGDPGNAAAVAMRDAIDDHYSPLERKYPHD